MDKKSDMSHDFPSNLLCRNVHENFAGSPFNVSVYSDIEKIYAYERNITVFNSKFVA